MGFPYSSQMRFLWISDILMCSGTTPWALAKTHAGFFRQKHTAVQTWFSSWVSSNNRPSGTFQWNWHFLLREVQGLYKTDMAGQEWNALSGLHVLSLHGSTQSKAIQPGHNSSIHPQPWRQHWEQSREIRECWGEGQERCLSKGLAMGLLQGGGTIQNGAVGTAMLDQAVWIRMKLYETSGEEGRLAQRF